MRVISDSESEPHLDEADEQHASMALIHMFVDSSLGEVPMVLGI
jgi:hypothetical protein